MKYLLDTCVISDLVKGEKGTLNRLLSHPPDLIAVSTITVMEIEYGLALQKERGKKLRTKIEAFLETVHLLPFTLEEARSAAKIRMELRRLGNPIGPYDVLLAGSALQKRLIFVTSNMKEFERVEGLLIENWRLPIVP